MSSDSVVAVDNSGWAFDVLTSSRLKPYEVSLRGDLSGALRLYAINISTSAIMFTWLAFAEVALRNSLIRSIEQRLPNGTNDPLEEICFHLDSREQAAYNKAKSRLQKKGMLYSFDTLVTELTFGFWKSLLAPRYQTTLWVNFFRFAFPHLKPQNRAVVFEAVEAAVELRNRIAHHEPIFRRELGSDLRQIQQIIGWISPEALAWARENLPKNG
jgi:hypothetical protein